MGFLEFRQVFGNNRLINIENVVTYFNGLDRRRLYEWQKKGYLKRLANNVYIFADRPVDDILLKAAAGQIYQPSYIGLESAMSFHGFIPEAVFQTVSVTTRRHKSVRTPIGDFVYRCVKRGLFFGYELMRVDQESFFVSDAEKTLLDFLYFLPGSDDRDVLAGLRLNALKVRQCLDTQKMEDYLTLFASKKLNRAIAVLKELMDDSY